MHHLPAPASLPVSACHSPISSTLFVSSFLLVHQTARRSQTRSHKGICRMLSYPIQQLSGRQSARRQNAWVSGAVGSSSPGNSDSSSSEIPKERLVSRLLRPLKDFGFGRKSFWEGGVGMFVFAGVGEAALERVSLSLLITAGSCSVLFYRSACSAGDLQHSHILI